MLKELKLQTGSTGYVLPRPRKWLRGEAAKVLNEFQDLLGLTKSNFHSLRASFITELLRQGVSTVEVRAMVGHSDLKTTQRYVRLSGSSLIGVTESISIDLNKDGGELPKKRNVDG